MRNLVPLLSILCAAAQADDVLIMASNTLSPGQVIAGNDLEMILTTDSPCYIIGLGDEFPFHGMIPKQGDTEAVCWAFTDNHTITVITGDRQKTVYGQAELPRAEVSADGDSW